MYARARFNRTFVTKTLLPILGGAVIAGITAFLFWLMDKYLL